MKAYGAVEVYLHALLTEVLDGFEWEAWRYNPLKKNSMVWVREQTIPTERPPLVGEVIANLCG
jgi:hypothetical protein